MKNNKYIKEVQKWAFEFIMAHYVIGGIILWVAGFSFWGYLVTQISKIKGELAKGLPIDLDWTFYFLVFLFIITFSILIRTYLKALALSKQYLKLKNIAEGIGVKGFYPHNTEQDKKQDWEALASGIASGSAKNLYILGLTGWNTFGSPSTPLHGVISQFKGTVNVLLLNPKSEAFKTRMIEIQANEKTHQSELINTLKSCHLLKKAGINIKVTLYSHRPIWKMIFTDSYMWLQHYSKNNHVDDNPVYSFYKNDNGTSIFLPLTEVFEKRLRDDGSIELDLEALNVDELTS
ncbi:hypothetical protein [Methylomicrobium lacus]|uniref:hypothetical protein n=1 Tax=Methylomicrobium lacus TaxID=136992 RepID=UPI0035A905DB